MANTALGTYTAGQAKVIPIDHTGPASYTTGGETFGNLNNQTGISILGLSTLDFVEPLGPTNSGNYVVYSIPSGKGERKTFTLVWVTATTGIPTGTQVTAGTNLSGETARILVIGR